MTILAFETFSFFFFLCLVRLIKSTNQQIFSVLAASAAMYTLKTSAFDFFYLFGLTQISFLAISLFAGAQAPLKSQRKVIWLTGIGLLVGQLVYFKTVGSESPLPGLRAPAGLAYLTLQLIGIFIWAFFQKDMARLSWLKFCFAALFFPTLIAGPILRNEKIAEQLSPRRPVDPKQRLMLQSAFLMICVGMFKKSVGDQLGLFVNDEHALAVPQGWNAMLLTFAFYAQLYADFSGYSDIARGLARTFGIDVPANFNLPFLARNITDHWKRWHISLNEWFRDYVFTWLFASNFTKVRRWIPTLSSRIYLGLSILLTCLLIGAWHGISARYLLWAIINAALILAHQGLFADRWKSLKNNRPFQVISVLVTFLLTAFLNLLFLDMTIQQIGQIALSTLNAEHYVLYFARDKAVIVYSCALILVATVGLHALDRKLIENDFHMVSRFRFFVLSLFALVYCFSTGAIHQAFLYSQF